VIGAAWATKSSAMILSVTLRSPFHKSCHGPVSAALEALDMTVPFWSCAMGCAWRATGAAAVLTCRPRPASLAVVAMAQAAF
jgi:hypothetical protein